MRQTIEYSNDSFLSLSLSLSLSFSFLVSWFSFPLVIFLLLQFDFRYLFRRDRPACLPLLSLSLSPHTFRFGSVRSDWYFAHARTFHFWTRLDFFHGSMCIHTKDIVTFECLYSSSFMCMCLCVCLSHFLPFRPKFIENETFWRQSDSFWHQHT